MERLTVKTENGNVLACCVGCESVNSCSAPCENYFKAIDKLSTLEDAEEQGLLITLPCKIGDTVWYTQEQYRGKIIAKPVTVSQITIDGCIKIIGVEERQNTQVLWADDIGKTVFLTREAAEEALKGGGVE